MWWWTVQTSPPAPIPPWFDGRQPLTAIKRLARAAWIITDGPPQWRMFALGELAELASTDFDGASEIYHAALEGRLQHRPPTAAP